MAGFFECYHCSLSAQIQTLSIILTALFVVQPKQDLSDSA